MTETFFARLSFADRAELERVGHRRRFPAGSTLFLEGEEPDEVVVVHDGLIKLVVVSVDGREVILDVVGSGDLLGELAALDGGPRSATAQAATDVTVLSVDTADFGAFLLARPSALYHLAVLLARRLRASDHRQLEFRTEDSLARLCTRLVELADRFGTLDDDGMTHVESPLSQADLGSWAGLSREAIVKAMRALRRMGWIDNDGPSITIREPGLVRDRAGN